MIKAILKTFGVFLLTGGAVGLLLPRADGNTQALIGLGVPLVFLLLTFNRDRYESESSRAEKRRWRRKYASSAAFGEIVQQIRTIKPASVQMRVRQGKTPDRVLLLDSREAVLREIPWPSGALVPEDVYAGMQHFGPWLNEQLQGAAVYEVSRLMEAGSVYQYNSYTISEDFHGELHAYRDADVTPDRLLGYCLRRR